MSTRLPPSQGQPPWILRVYKSSLRPIVIGTAFMTAVWSLLASIGFYRNIGPYNDNDAPKLATISIIIGSIYMGVFLIGLYGVFAAFSRKLQPVRIFAFLSVLAVLMVAGVNLLRVIIHFTMKKTILDACTNVATGETFFYAGWWGPVYSGTLSFREAQRFCSRYYDRDSWSLIIGLILLTIIGSFFSHLAFGFLYQTRDPAAPGNVTRDPLRSTPGYYTAPYSNTHPGFGQSYPNYAPPPGQPAFSYSGPPGGEDDAKPPGYTGEGWEDMQKKRDEEAAAPKTGDVRY